MRTIARQSGLRKGVRKPPLTLHAGIGPIRTVAGWMRFHILLSYVSRLFFPRVRATLLYCNVVPLLCTCPVSKKAASPLWCKRPAADRQIAYFLRPHRTD